MNILSIESLSKSYGFKPLLENVTFGLDENDRVGIVGLNGSGKTTLLRIIAGVEPPDGGRVATARDRSLAFMPQNPTYGDDETVFDAVFPPTNPRMQLLREYEAACHALEASADPAALDRVAALTAQLESEGGWDLEANARIVLTELGVGNLQALVRTLSGGQRRRVALAAALVAHPDILVLDEPTNHLDAGTTEWLEQYLARYTGALLLVTHDRYLLDRVTTRTFEVDRGRVRVYIGAYADYLEKKDLEERQRLAAEHKIASMARRELAWLRRGAQARSTKPKARIQTAEALIANRGEGPRAELEISAVSRRLGKRVVTLDGISKAYGSATLLDGFGYAFKRDDRIGVIGPNGVGKTTLLEIISSRVAPDSGTLEVGATVAIGYFDQEARVLESSQRVIDFVRSTAEFVQVADGETITASQMLERFLFSGDAQYASIENLSGGEKRRLALLRVLMEAPNVLILDEPTNDLDIQTLVALEEYLDTFPGCLIAVSHDRSFLDRTVDHIFQFEGDGLVRIWPGNYSTFAELRAREERERRDAAERPPQPKPAQAAAAKPSAPDGPRKLTYKEQRELEQLEARIATAEARRAEIQAQMVAEAADYAVVNALYGELQELEAALDRDMERWAELA